MKMAVFWDVAPCILEVIDRRLGGAYCLHHQGDISTRLHGTASQKRAIFILAAVRT
jgi:hypothetical protein